MVIYFNKFICIWYADIRITPTPSKTQSSMESSRNMYSFGINFETVTHKVYTIRRLSTTILISLSLMFGEKAGINMTTLIRLAQRVLFVQTILSGLMPFTIDVSEEDLWLSVHSIIDTDCGTKARWENSNHSSDLWKSHGQNIFILFALLWNKNKLLLTKWMKDDYCWLKRLMYVNEFDPNSNKFLSNRVNKKTRINAQTVQNFNEKNDLKLNSIEHRHTS